MLTVLMYSAFVLWAAIAIVALILCDVSARRAAHSRVTATERRARQAPARVAINARGF